MGRQEEPGRGKRSRWELEKMGQDRWHLGGASPAPTFFSLYCRKYRSHTAHSARYFFSTTIVLLEDISLPLFISSREGWSHYSFVLARGFSPLLRSWHRRSSACISSCC